MKCAIGVVAVALLFLSVRPAAVPASNGRSGDTRFSGNGTTLLPPLRFTRSVVVHWHAGGNLFVLVGVQAPASFGRLPRLVASKATSGSRRLPKGIYRFRVVTRGSWSASITLS